MYGVFNPHRVSMDSCLSAASYDDQATTYNARAGLGLEVSRGERKPSGEPPKPGRTVHFWRSAPAPVRSVPSSAVGRGATWGSIYPRRCWPAGLSSFERRTRGSSRSSRLSTAGTPTASRPPYAANTWGRSCTRTDRFQDAPACPPFVLCDITEGQWKLLAERPSSYLARVY